MESIEYKLEVASRDLEGNKEFQPLLKSRSQGFTAAFTGLGMFGVGACVALPWFVIGDYTIFDRIADSAKSDMNYSVFYQEEREKEKKAKEARRREKEAKHTPLKNSVEDDDEVIEDLEDVYKVR